MSHCCSCCCFSTLHLSKRCLLLLFVIFIVDNSPLCYTFFNAPSLIHINNYYKHREKRIQTATTVDWLHNQLIPSLGVHKTRKDKFHTLWFFCYSHQPLSLILAIVTLACDHALSLYLFNLFSEGGHDTFLSQITCKNARIWTFFWLDRKQYGWFALFRLAKMLPSVSCCWFQSAFLLS